MTHSGVAAHRLPLVGAAILLLGGKATNTWGHLLGCLAVAGIVRRRCWCCSSTCSAATRTTACIHQTLFSWVPVGGLHVDFGLQLDQLVDVFRAADHRASAR